MTAFLAPLDFQKQITHAAKAKGGGASYSEIRLQLIEKGYTEQEATAILKAADAQLLEGLSEEKPILAKYINFKLVGLLLIGLGVFVTVFSYKNVEVSGGYYLVVYGPVVTGLALYFRRDRIFNPKKPFFKSPFKRWGD